MWVLYFSMNKSRFHLLLSLSIIFPIMSLMASLVFPNENIELTYRFIEELESANTGYPDMDMLLVPASIILLVLLIATYVGLFLFKPWARLFFVMGFVLSIPTYFIGGLWVSSGLDQLFYDAYLLTSGAIIAVAYYSPVNNFFEDAQI
jgi:hypothetical protein